MTTNQTIDGVPRELRALLERVAGKASQTPHWDALDEDRIAATSELRALLDADKVNNRQMGLIQFVEAHPIKPAAQPQGEPVAWLNVATGHVTTSAVEVMDWDDEKEQVQSLYAEQPAPVAVVLPEHRDSDLRSPTYGFARGWNACLDEVARLTATVRTPEPLVMTDGLHTYEYVTGHNAAIDKMLGVKS
ncbi:hypothetical protein 7F11_20 [uncultured Caudovirales phage]|nr:hypothetical protein 7AX2_55 [uncultured phage]ASN68155.1 hypothetical protein 7S5_34 [uncultured Caudovirales phage]ASN68916.1 hypothetical protein 7F11_20 [uncultured Caudovirales phage]ASN68990.1 hypothetical protein 8AX2_19 [uncultured Caudovirales phage]